jgi:hypothetical protein
MTKIIFNGFILIMRTDKVTFGAKPINDVIIKKYNKSKKEYVDFPAKFVKLEAGNYSDIKVVDKIAQQWTNAVYIKKIATASHWMKTLPIEIYALTTQKDKFDRLKSSKILGFAEMRKEKDFPDYDSLYYLQVKPQVMNITGYDNKSYKYTGTSIIKSLKKIYHNISLFSADSPNVENFYRKNGFIKDYMLTRHYLWSSNPLKRLKIQILNFRFEYGI